jgi:acyl carrier protein
MVKAKLVLLTVGSSLDDGPGPIAQQLQELEALGCEVLQVRTTVFDTEHLESAFGQAESHFGRITGVIHAADMSNPRLLSLIKDLDSSACDRYWRQQQQTVTALEVCLRRRNVDFCLLMSSLASEVGGMGQVAHTTASLYLDAFVHRHNQNEECPWIVVDWDVWKAEEEGAGVDSVLAKIAITPSEGADAFRRIVHAGTFERILVSTTDPGFRQEAIRGMHGSRTVPQPGGTTDEVADPTGSHQRPDLPTAYGAPRNEAEAAVAELWQDVLGIDRIGIHDNFFELGGHSLLATQLVSRLQQAFQTSVELDIFFSAPSIAELTEAILRKQLEQSAGDQMTQLLDRLEEMTEENAEALLASDNLPEALLDALANKVRPGRGF